MKRLRPLFIALLAPLPFLGAFYYLAHRTFEADKKAFVINLNRTLVEATTGKFRLALKSRMDDLQTLIPKVLEANPELPTKVDFFAGLSSPIKQELLSVTFFKKKDNRYEAYRQYRNQRALKRKLVSKEALSTIYQKHPLPLETFAADKRIRLLNRSAAIAGKKGDGNLAVITLLLDGAFLKTAAPETLLAVDLLGDAFLQILEEAEIAEVFLIQRDGKIFAHPNPQWTVEFSEKALDHPVLAQLNSGTATELNFRGETFYVSSAESGFPDIYVVAQTRKSDALVALKTLMEKGILLALLAAALTASLAAVFALLRRRPISTDLEDLEPPPPPRKAIPAPGKKPAALAAVPAKAKRKSLLFQNEQVEVHLFFPEETQSGALAGAMSQDSRVFFFVGEVRPSELPKNLMTEALEIAALALKDRSEKGWGLPEFATSLGDRLHQVFRGRLFMTLTAGTLDLRTGTLDFLNASHPGPLVVRPPAADKQESSIEILEQQADRLGAKAGTRFDPKTFALGKGAEVLIYTQGIVEAKGRNGNAWGEKGLMTALTKALTDGSSAPMETLVQIFQKHTEGQLPKGDRALLLMRWRGANMAAGAGSPSLSDFFDFSGDPEVSSREAWLYSREEEADAEEEVTMISERKVA